MVGQVGDAVLGAMGSIEAGQAEKNVDYANAANERTASNTELATGAANAAAVERRATVAGGQAQANASASGVSGTTPLAVMHNIASQGALSKQLTLWNSRNRARALLAGAAIDTAEGQQAEQAGIITGGLTVLTAADKAAKDAATAGATAGG